MKAKLIKLLRSCSAAWITSIEKEPIIGLLKGKWHSTYDPLKYAIDKGWVRVDIDEDPKRDYYYFTEKGKVEILNKLKDTTCISGRIVH